MSTKSTLNDTSTLRLPQPTSTSAPASPVALKTDIVVIGAGQAGLASAYHLKKRGLVPDRGFVVLDQAPRPGGAWQFRWPSLKLSNVNRIHDLPGMPFSEAVDTDATEVEAKVAVPRYFAAYEKTFDLPVYRPVKVTVVCDRGERLRIETDRGNFPVRGVTNATGTWETAYIPEYPGADRFMGRQLHTKDYRTADEFAGQHVVIVGGGISAIQLLDEVSRHHHDMGHPETAAVPPRPLYRRPRPCRRGAGRRPGASRLAAKLSRFGNGAASHPRGGGHASPRGAEPPADVQRDPRRRRPLARRHRRSCRCHPLVHRVSQLARSSGATDAARRGRRHHDERQIGHTGCKGPTDSFGWLRPLRLDHRSKSRRCSCRKRVDGISWAHVTILQAC